MVLELTQQHMNELAAHAERVYPEECCGLMLGNLTPQTETVPRSKQLLELVPLNNEWKPGILTASRGVEVDTEKHDTTSAHFDTSGNSKKRRYWIDPKDMLRVQREAREKELNIIGIYHSHPDHVAEPSECDRTLAWPEYAYIIVSVRKGKAVDVQNWALDSNHQFQSEPMRLSSSTTAQSATTKVLLS